MRILVIGGGGFLGNPLVEALAKTRTNQLQVLDVFTHGFPKKLPKKKNIERPINGNICNYSHVLSTMERFRPQVVVHLAAFNGRPESFGDFRTCAQVNYLGTANVLQASMSLRTRPQKLIFASSLAAAEPAMHYGISKRAAEDLLLSTLPRFTELDIGLSILRFGEIYGDSPSYTSTCLINFMIDHMLVGNDLAFYGVNHKKDFIHISDAVTASVLAVNSETQHPPVMDIGTGQGRVIKDVIQQLKGLTDYNGRLKFLESDKVPVQDEVAVIELAQRVLGFTPAADFDSSVKDLVAKRRKVLR